MFGLGFLVFWREVFYAPQGCLHLIKDSKNTDIVKYYYNLKQLFSNLVYFRI